MSAISSTDTGRGTAHLASSNDLLQRHAQVKRMTIEISLELHTTIKQAAASEGRYARDLIVDAVEGYLESHGYIVTDNDND